VDYEYFAGMIALDGREFRLYTDPDRLERHMKELSPADVKPTEEFCRFVRGLRTSTSPWAARPSLWDSWTA